ncbi:sensor histidine kinase [Catenovulum sp. SX2]|uniref:sensor histidine kinase n=1 Tax=Catenovulum sp. SX2 TaxID=3398614 RepID=UPI003F861827
MNKLFWFIHSAFLLIYISPQLAQFLLTNWHLANYDLLEKCVKAGLITLLVLSFRWFYLKGAWVKFTIGKQLLISLLFAVLAAFLLAVILSVIMYPIYWFDLFNSQAVSIYDISIQREHNSEGVYFTLVTDGYARNAYTEYFSLGLLSISTSSRDAMMFLLWVCPYITQAINSSNHQQQINALKLQNQVKQAQLATLATQLNPHFLFNSLNNIRFTYQLDPEKADDAITSLSEVLRYALVYGKQDKVALQQEIEVIEAYIAVNKLHLEERLNFQLAVTASTQVLIPPMMLQLLVENAIKHAVEQLSDTSTLSVEIKEKSEQLHIEVTNPIVPESTTTHTSSTGTGLENIKQRLELMYAQAAKFETTIDNGLFKATVILPVEHI